MPTILCRLNYGDAMTRRSVVLVGAEYEENLSLRYLSSSLSAAGFAPTIVAFDVADRLEAAVDATLSLERS